MENKNDIVMPRNYSAIEDFEMQQVIGGAASLYSILNFISVLLSGFDISFGSQNSHVNTDTAATASQASTGSSGRTDASSVSAVATHSTVDTITSGQFFDWTASFNLSNIFNALSQLFL